MDGWINVLKPPGPTSHAVVQQVRRGLGGLKLGHTGTLDPAAAGVLVLAAGRATRLAEEVGGEAKAYRAVMVLGIATSTQDLAGEVLSRQPFPRVSPEQLREVLPSFTGKLAQVPPMVSALHYQGRRLYELARQGLEVDRPPREVTVYRLDLLGIDLNRPFPLLTIDVLCSRGTYVRTLCADLGQALGCPATLGFLLRYRVGSFSSEAAWTLEEISAQISRGETSFLLPPAAGLSHLAVLTVEPRRVAGVLSGRPLVLPRGEGVAGIEPGKRVRIEDGRQLLAIGRVEAQGGNLVIRMDKVVGPI